MGISKMKTYEVKVYGNGDKSWYLNDKLHREDGPAIEYSNGYKVWYLNDKLHRVDGPAVKGSDGYKAWYLDGVKYTEEEFNQKINSCDGKVVEIDGKRYRLNEV